MSDLPQNQTRRHFCAALAAAATSVVLPGQMRGEEQGQPTGSSHAGSDVNPDEAIKRLLEGNQRFVSGKARHPHEAKDWRLSLEGGQHPYACILGCADLRVTPELLFDQGFGDLFVIRIGGNIVDTDVAASIEYAVDHLGIELVLVLGHSKCGAVTATLDHLMDVAGEPDELVSLLYRIEPALEGLPQNLSRHDRVALAVKKNVQFAVRRLSLVPDLRKSMRKNDLRIVGAIYNMHTGKVALLDQNESQ